MTHTNTKNVIPLDEESALCSDLYLTTHNIHKRKTYMPAAGFEPATLPSERPQTCALHSAATWIVKTVFQVLIFLEAVAKLLKAIISFFISLCPTFGQSVRVDKLVSHSKDFHENFYLRIFPKSVDK